ncbi:GNAT family N-acetyltransferase, partial [Rhodococcus koreensis]|uniref:GNAT family N-acetyltransferase n=1 Tax=Rhodococcus koreensis TaxID=99653 RepID=UPI00366DE5D1
MIRPAISTDLPALQDIEIAAGAPFRDIGMDAVADDPPFSLDELTEYLQLECIWVAVDADDAPVAYALVAVVDGGAHIEQVSVHPGHARQGLGALLLDEISSWGGGPGRGPAPHNTMGDAPEEPPKLDRGGVSAQPP